MYKERFFQAISRSRRLGLSTPDVQSINGSVLTSDMMKKFPFLLRDQFGELEIQDLALQCLSINYRLQEDIEEIFKVPCYYTIGHIKTIDGGNMFYKSEEELKGMLSDVKHAPKTVNIHAWLTLATMEILDISIATSIQVANGETPEGRVLARNPDELYDFEYIPMLVGDDFLEKSGAIVRLTV